MRVGEAKNPGPRRDISNGFGKRVAPNSALRGLTIITMNITAWASAMPFIKSTPADVILIQEHHLRDDRINAASNGASTTVTNRSGAPL